MPIFAIIWQIVESDRKRKIAAIRLSRITIEELVSGLRCQNQRIEVKGQRIADENLPELIPSCGPDCEITQTMSMVMLQLHEQFFRRDCYEPFRAKGNMLIRAGEGWRMYNLATSGGGEGDMVTHIGRGVGMSH